MKLIGIFLVMLSVSACRSESTSSAKEVAHSDSSVPFMSNSVRYKSVKIGKNKDLECWFKKVNSNKPELITPMAIDSKHYGQETIVLRVQEQQGSLNPVCGVTTSVGVFPRVKEILENGHRDDVNYMSEGSAAGLNPSNEEERVRRCFLEVMNVFESNAQGIASNVSCESEVAPIFK